MTIAESDVQPESAAPRASVRFVHPNEINPSPTNPRKVFRHIDDLAASLKAKGVLAPLIVREQAFEFELVCGERRWRAAKLAGLDTVPVIVRELSDKEVLEIQTIENDQRQDVTPMEQARGYQALIDQGYDVATIAAKVGRDASYVRHRLQLATLNEQAQQWLDEEKILLGHGIQIARLAPEQQEKVLKERIFDGVVNGYASAPSIERLRETIVELFHLNLKTAPFPTGDATLLPNIPACPDCPKRAGNTPELWNDIKSGDTCTDPCCFKRKQQAFVSLQVTRCKEQNADAVQISVRSYTDSKGILGMNSFEIVPAKEAKKAKPGELTPAVIVESSNADPKAGKLGQQVMVRVKAKPKASAKSKTYDYQAEQEKHRRLADLGRTARMEIAIAIAEKLSSPDSGEFRAFVGRYIRSNLDQRQREAMKTALGEDRADPNKVPDYDLLLLLMRAEAFGCADGFTHPPLNCNPSLAVLAKQHRVDTAAIIKKTKAGAAAAEKATKSAIALVHASHAPTTQSKGKKAKAKR